MQLRRSASVVAAPTAPPGAASAYTLPAPPIAPSRKNVRRRMAAQYRTDCPRSRGSGFLTAGALAKAVSRTCTDDRVRCRSASRRTPRATHLRLCAVDGGYPAATAVARTWPVLSVGLDGHNLHDRAGDVRAILDH